METVEVILSDWHDTVGTKSKVALLLMMYKSMDRDQRERAGCPSVTLRETSHLCRCAYTTYLHRYEVSLRVTDGLQVHSILIIMKVTMLTKERFMLLL